MHMTESALTIPRDMKKVTIETQDGILEFHGKLLGMVDNERRGRPRWAEIKLYKYLDTDPAHVVVDDDGIPIGELSTYGKEVYLLHTMGHSIVYHGHESDCNRGVTVAVEDFENRAEFPDWLEPCEDCHPPDWELAEDGTLYELEVLRHTIAPCRNAEAVLERLRRKSKKTCPQCNGSGSYPKFTRQVCSECHANGYVDGPSVLSAPGQRLIEMVKYKDPEIKKAASRSVKL